MGQPQNNTKLVQPKKSNAGKIILIIVVVILILGVLAVMAVVNFVKGIFNKVTNSDEVQGIIKTYEEMGNVAEEAMDIIEKKADEIEQLDVKSIVESSQTEPIEIEIIEVKIRGENIKQFSVYGKANYKIKKYDELLSKNGTYDNYKNFINQNKKALGINYDADFSTSNFAEIAVTYYSEKDGYVRIADEVMNAQRIVDLSIWGTLEKDDERTKKFYDVVKNEFGIDLLSIKEYSEGVEFS